MKLSLAKTLSLAALALVIGTSVAAPAHADWDDRGYRGRGDYERHERHEWRERHAFYGRPYAYYPVYSQPVYVPPRVIYAPRPVYVEREPVFPGFNFLFNIR